MIPRNKTTMKDNYLFDSFIPFKCLQKNYWILKLSKEVVLMILNLLNNYPMQGKKLRNL